MTDASLAATIDKAWEERATINAATKGEVRDAVNETLNALDSGKLRVAEKIPGKVGKDSWTVHQWARRPCCSRSA